MPSSRPRLRSPTTYIYIYTNPSAKAGCEIWSIFKVEFNLVWIQSILSPRLVAILKLKNPVCSTIYVIYWPSNEPSIKRSTCVDKRKNSRSRWTLENNITRCLNGSSQLETGCRSENQLADWGLCGPQWPTDEQPKPRCERTWVNIAVHPCLHSFLTHNKHHPFENKVW